MLHDKAPALLKAVKTLDEFSTWLADNPEELEDAARLLGGAKWAALAYRVIMAVRSGAGLAAVLPELRRLVGLLTLQCADDLSSDEARRFMSVHPDDPRADNARRCAEAVQRGIAALERVTAVPSRRAA